MKHAWIGAGILLAVLAFSLFASGRVKDAALQTRALLEQAAQQAEGGSTEQALDILREAEKTWQSHERFFGTVLHHEQMDDVLTQIAALGEYGRLEDLDDFLSGCRALMAKLAQLYAMERLTPENLF